MLLRFALVLLPVILAASWAIFRIYGPAKEQAEDFLNQ